MKEEGIGYDGEDIKKANKGRMRARMTKERKRKENEDK